MKKPSMMNTALAAALMAPMFASSFFDPYKPSFRAPFSPDLPDENPSRFIPQVMEEAKLKRERKALRKQQQRERSGK